MNILKTKSDNQTIRQSCDDEITKFMSEKWGEDWEENEQAESFYEKTACDLRFDAETNAIELYREISK